MVETPRRRSGVAQSSRIQVSELSNALKRTVEQTYDNVRVRGEVSGFKRHSSGHLYFCLKDSDAVLDAVCWRGAAGRLAVNPEDGLEVVATGRLTTYPGRSKYQMVVERLELAGLGRSAQTSRGPQAASGGGGTVRSGTEKEAAVPARGYRRRHLADRRGDSGHPASSGRSLSPPRPAVAGGGAGRRRAEQVAAAIDGFNRLPPDGEVPRPDLLIVARGGGSLEDLWAFNEEMVVRAAAASRHSADFGGRPRNRHHADRLCRRLARADAHRRRRDGGSGAARAAAAGHGQEPPADRRSEPSDRRAADSPGRTGAWTAGPEPADRRPDARARRQERAAGQRPAQLPRPPPGESGPCDGAVTPSARADCPQASRSGATGDPSWRRHEGSPGAVQLARLERSRLQLGQTASRLDTALPRLLDGRRSTVERAAALLQSLSYQQVLRRGFALVRDAGGEPVTSAEHARSGDRWTVTFQAEQTVPVIVDGAQPPTKAPDHKASSKAKDARQGSLL